MDKNKFINSFNLSLICIFLCCCILFALGYAKFGMFFIDTSREAYIPMAMNNGAVLYKDIYNVYSPLGYQINAILYSLFGENLKTLYFAGLANCFIFLVGFFVLAKEFFKQSNRIPLFLTLFIMSFCAFAISLFNYILPYSYSMVYAMSAFTWSLFFLVKYIQNNSSKHLAISFLLFGMSIAFKYEYMLFSLVLFSIPFLKKETLKTKLLCLVSFFIVPAISVVSLIIQGCEVSDFLQAFSYMTLLAKAQSVKSCYQTMGLIPTVESIKTLFVSTIKTIPFVSVIYFLLYKFLVKNNEKKVFSVISIVIFSVLFIYFLYPIFVESNSSFFNWIGFINIIIFAFVFNKTKGSLEDFDKMFLILTASSIFVSVKNICSITSSNYGNFFFPFLFLTLIVFILYYCPKYFYKNVEVKEYNNSLCIILLISIILFCLSNVERRLFAFPSKVETEKGTIYVEESKVDAINKSISYIKQNTKPTDKILVLCEGAMINFLTSRMSDNNYYYLIPPNIQVFGEDSIVQNLEKNIPDYIVLQPMSYLNFKETFFCESFGQKICNLLPKYYEPPIVFGSDFWIAVYKRKSNK